MKDLTILMAAPLCFILAACQSQDTENTGTELTRDTTAFVGSDPDLPAPAIPGIKIEYSDEGRIADTDGDGIPDDSDPYPLNVPLLSDESSPSVAIVFEREVASELIAIDNVVVSGKEVRVSIDGADDGQPLWIQWRGEGINISEPVQFGENRILAPEIRVNQVAIIYGNRVNTGTPIQGYYQNEPWFYPITKNLMAGEIVNLRGENLQNVTNPSIGGVPLALTTVSTNQVSFRLPALPNSQTLKWQISGTDRNDQVVLPVFRKVSMTLKEDVAPEDWRYMNGLISGETEIVIPAGKPEEVYLSHPQYLLNLSAVIWPDQTDVPIGADSTLEHWLYRAARISGRIKFNWQQDRRYLPDSGDMAYLIQALADDLNDYTNTASAMFAALDFDDIPWNTQHTLNAMTYPAGHAPLYSQSVSVTNLRASPGSDTYSLVGLQHYGDTTGCWGVENITRPSGLWGSDICVANSGPTFISISVKDKNGKVIRSHIGGRTRLQRWLHQDILGPGWLTVPSPKAYLTSNSGSPLCHMEKCTVEILTGGWGTGTSVSLTAKEQEVYTILFTRTLVESVLLDTLASIAGGGQSTAQCMLDTVLSSTSSFNKLLTTGGTTIHKLEAAPNAKERMKVVLELLAAEAWSLFQGKLAEAISKKGGLPSSCTDPADKLKDATSSVTKQFIVIKVAEIVNQVVKNFTTAITPEKIVYSVQPKANIDSVWVSGAIALEPGQTDTTLSIEGCHISNQIYDLSTGQPDTDYNYWPDLLLTDRRGKTTRLSLDPSTTVNLPEENQIKLLPVAGRCESRFVIPASQLIPVLNTLSYGMVRADLRIRLSYDTDEFSTFPNSELPLRGGVFEWSGPAKLTGLNTSYLLPGATNTLLGENLHKIKNKPMKVYLDKGAGQPIIISDVTYREGVIDFVTPVTLASGQYTVYVITDTSTGEGVTLSQPVTAAPPKLSYIRVTDRGVKHDDEMLVELFDSDDIYPLSVSGTPVTITLSAGSKDRTGVLYFNGDSLVNQIDDGAIQLPIEVQLQCKKGGSDGFCTWGIDVKVTTPSGSLVSASSSGKLKAGGYESLVLK